MLYMIPMDEQFRTNILDSQSVNPVAWVTVVGAKSGTAVRIEFKHIKAGINYTPTIQQAIQAMRDPDYDLVDFVKAELGAVIVWLEDETPVAIPTNEAPERKQ